MSKMQIEPIEAYKNKNFGYQIKLPTTFIHNYFYLTISKNRENHMIKF